MSFPAVFYNASLRLWLLNQAVRDRWYDLFLSLPILVIGL